MKKIILHLIFAGVALNFVPYANAGEALIGSSRLSQAPDGTIRVTSNTIETSMPVSTPKTKKIPVMSSRSNFSSNQGVIYASGGPQYKRFIPGSSHIGGFTAPNNFADRHAWRSGFAGTVAMWRQFIANALPSDEPFPETKKKTAKPASKIKNK